MVMLFSILAPMLLAAGRVTFGAALLSEARASNEGDADLQLDPTLAVAVPVGAGSFYASYRPRIVVLLPRSRGPTSLLHRGGLGGQWPTGRAGRVFVDQQVDYGREVFSLLVVAAEGGQLGQIAFDRLLTQSQLPPLRYFGETTLLGTEQQIARRLQLTATASYSVSGAADPSARGSLPLQHGPTAHLGLSWSVHSRNTLSAALDATAGYFSNSRRAYVLDVTVGWGHQFSAITSLAVLAGVGGGSETGEGSTGAIYVFYPYVDGVLRRQPKEGRGPRFGLTFRVRVSPAIDPVTGQVFARGDGLAGVDFYPSNKLRLSALGGGAVGLSGSLRGRTIGLGILSASYDLSRYVVVSGGGRVVSQPITEWVGFISLALSYPQHN